MTTMNPHYCDQHPQMMARLDRMERLIWLGIGLAFGSGILQLSQVVGP